MPKSVSYQEELIKYLKDNKKAVVYLNNALEEGDPELFLLALRNVAEAQGVVTHFSRNSERQPGAELSGMELHSFLLLLKNLGLGLIVKETSRVA